MALKDRFRKAIGRPTDRKDSASSSTTKPGTGTTSPNGAPLTTTSTLSDPPAETKHNLTPAITLTKSPSRLTKTLTWRAAHSKGKEHSNTSNTHGMSKKEAKALESWKRNDAVEWTSPTIQRPGRKNQDCQNTLRAFDFQGLQEKERSDSLTSEISPNHSRANSVDDGSLLLEKRKRSSAAGFGVGPGKLSQEVRREDGKSVDEKVGEI